MRRGETPTVAEVAEAALISKSTAYRYFPSQERSWRRPAGRGQPAGPGGRLRGGGAPGPPRRGWTRSCVPTTPWSPSTRRPSARSCGPCWPPCRRPVRGPAAARPSPALPRRRPRAAPRPARRGTPAAPGVGPGDVRRAGEHHGADGHRRPHPGRPRRSSAGPPPRCCTRRSPRRRGRRPSGMAESPVPRCGTAHRHLRGRRRRPTRNASLSRKAPPTDDVGHQPGDAPVKGLPPNRFRVSRSQCKLQGIRTPTFGAGDCSASGGRVKGSGLLSNRTHAPLVFVLYGLGDSRSGSHPAMPARTMEQWRQTVVGAKHATDS